MTTSKAAIARVTKTLKGIIADDPRSLRAAVAQEALDYGTDNPTDMFHSLAQGGCQSGTIGSLIYYADTRAFFDEFYDDIEELREDWEDQLGQPLNIKGDLKNWLAWFGFEETARRMAHDDLGLEL